MQTAALDALRNEVTQLLKERPDWLEAITVHCPSGTKKADWRSKVEEMLFELHLDGIDVRVGDEATKGPWIQERHMGAGWS